jgi:hypothetical protein
MSYDKPKVSDKASEIAKNMWLAGLGAYGKAFDDAQGRIDKAAKEPPRLFRELVEKGSIIEDEVRDSLSSIKENSTNSVEERISKVRESFNFSFTRGQELADIHRKLDELSAKIDTLADAVGTGQGAKARRSKAPTKTRSKSTRGKKSGGSSRS